MPKSISTETQYYVALPNASSHPYLMKIDVSIGGDTEKTKVTISHVMSHLSTASAPTNALVHTTKKPIAWLAGPTSGIFLLFLRRRLTNLMLEVRREGFS